MDVVVPPICNCSRFRAGSGAACGFCAGSLPPPSSSYDLLYTWPFALLIRVFEGRRSFAHALRLLGATIIGILVGLLTLGGASMGAVAGALAGRASERGVVRGALLGAIAGAILSLEILEASRAYWSLEQSGVRGPSSMADFIEELLQGRFLEDEFEPAVLTAYRWQVNISYRRYEEIREGIEGSESRGLSQHSLKKLSCHKILAELKPAESICCSICLLNIEAGDTVRSLPRCHHMFHMTCVDTWLVKCGSCPVCRQIVKCS